MYSLPIAQAVQPKVTTNGAASNVQCCVGGDDLFMVGYGGNSLQVASMSYICSPEACRIDRPDITDSMMCAFAAGVDACGNDRGGAILNDDDEQVGIISQFGCGSGGLPVVFTDTLFVSDFIEQAYRNLVCDGSACIESLLLPEPAPEVFCTASPTLLPTETPSADPTTSPTETPSNAPTSSPSESPSPSPSEQPTPAPTDLPTESPSESPTSQPSSNPSGKPTKMPSSGPSEAPIMAPTFSREFNTTEETSSDSSDSGSSESSEPSQSESESEEKRSKKPKKSPKSAAAMAKSSSQANDSAD